MRGGRESLSRGAAATETAADKTDEGKNQQPLPAHPREGTTNAAKSLTPPSLTGTEDGRPTEVWSGEGVQQRTSAASGGWSQGRDRILGTCRSSSFSFDAARNRLGAAGNGRARCMPVTGLAHSHGVGKMERGGPRSDSCCAPPRGGVTLVQGMREQCRFYGPPAVKQRARG